MKARPLTWMYRSMMGQVTLLALLYLGGLVYWFGLRPLLEIPWTGSGDPLPRTASEVSTRLSHLVERTRHAPQENVSLKDDAVLAQIKARNPGFRWYARVGDREFDSGDGELWFHSQHFDKLAALRADPTYPQVCSQTERDMRTPQGLGHLSYYDCEGVVSYYEYAGIRTPLDLDASLVPFYPKWVWDSSRGLMLTGAGMFVIFVLIVGINVIMIGRITAVTRSFDPKHLDRKLPEAGLPSEVVPLVQAVNEMITKVDQAQKRREFFLSTAAHEMRTPLTVLRTRLEMLADGALKDKLVGDVGRLTMLANQLLKLMSISGGRKLESLVDLGASCRRVIGERAPLAEARGVQLELRCGDGPVRVLGDPGLLDVAIANLVDNAVSFSPDGGRVEVGVSERAEVWVQDTGPGIAAEHLPTLFEPFAKFPPNRNGHGLGLAIVKAIAELHGGSVTAANVAQAGARFSLTLPPVVSAD
ncbi:sensor histidine kinase [Xanthomonas campestris]|uniref:sensor histidine kinase n=1 Tax=Xanthomonas campestris TaxID=339 RepID=UPI001E4577CC|nr:HAMP domain-containing sensor histidine kinase [Xanthomonas campestris]MCC4603057.1 HAMP domain-containing histidine kinase [Xanthomonas campestris pv. parthenii]